MNFYTPRSTLFKTYQQDDSPSSMDKQKKQVTRTVKICTSNIEEMMEIYRWRAETQFPIAKVKTVSIVPCDANDKDISQLRTLEVVFEELSLTFAELIDIPLFRILYLLKQTLIGLERLFSKFGSFLFTEEMIFVDQAGKCKVWINEQVQLNQFKVNDMKQHEFLSHAYNMFKSKTVETKQSANFYQGIKICNSFFSALEYLESYVERQKIKVMSFFRMQSSSNGTTSLEKKKKKIDLNMTMSKKPNFLVNMQFNSSKEESLANSKKEIFSSTKFIHQRAFFSKPEMKISGDTAPESEKNIKSSNDCSGSQSPVEFPRKLIGQKDLWYSDKQQRKQSKVEVARKFSNNIRQQYSPTIEIHAPTSFPAPSSLPQIPNQISQSLTFCDALDNSSRSSSADNKQKLIEKKKEVFNVNGWQLKVNSLFSNDSQFKKSFCQKNHKNTVKRPTVHLELLDKCTTNMCESFIEDHNERT